MTARLTFTELVWVVAGGRLSQLRDEALEDEADPDSTGLGSSDG